MKPSLVSDLWYIKFILAYTSTNTRFYACHIQRKKSASDLLTTNKRLVWQFWKVPNTSTCQVWKEKQKNTHTMTSLVCSKLVQAPDWKTRAEHPCGTYWRKGCSSHPCCQGETIVSYSCLELQSSEFRHYIWCIFGQGQSFTFLQKILSIQSKIFA